MNRELYRLRPENRSKNGKCLFIFLNASNFRIVKELSRMIAALVNINVSANFSFLKKFVLDILIRSNVIF